MNDQQDFERLVAGSLRSVGSVSPSDGAHELTSTRARQSRQDPEWLALIKEPPMRTDSRVAVGSPTFRLASIALATMLMTVLFAGAAVAAAQLLRGPATIDVSQDGSGDVTTIAEALEKADDGSTIRIHPGTYIESLHVTKDVTLMGTDRSEVVLTAAPDGPRVPVGEVGLVESTSPYVLRLGGSDASVSDLTIRGSDSAIIVEGGEPMLERLTVDGVKPVDGEGNSGAAIFVSAGSRATIRGSKLLGSGPIAVFHRSEPDIDSNLLQGGAGIYGSFGDEAIVRGNEIVDAVSHGIRVMAPTTMLIESNRISETPSTGIYVGWGRSVGVDPMIKGNTIVGSRNAINIESGATPSVVENEISEAETAINVRSGSPRIEGNTLRRNDGGIVVSFGRPLIEGNRIEDNAWPMATGSTAQPIVRDNVFCGNAEEISSYMPELVPDNDVCEEIATE